MNDYRSVLELCPSETEFQLALIDVGRRIAKFYKTEMYYGVTYEKSPTGAFCNTKIYCDTLEDIPLACYWIQVKGVRFIGKEFKFRFKIVRMVDECEVRRQLKVGDVKAITDSVVAVTETAKKINWNEVWTSWSESISDGTKEMLLLGFNFQSLVKVVKFIMFLVVGTFFAFTEACKFIGEFLIRFVAELSRLITVLTPILKALMDMISKIVAGFILFLAMVWRDSVGGGGGVRTRLPKSPAQHPAIMAPEPYPTSSTPLRPNLSYQPHDPRWQFLHGNSLPSNHMKKS